MSTRFYNLRLIICLIFLFFCGCVNDIKKKILPKEFVVIDSVIPIKADVGVKTQVINNNRQRIKLGHAVNTSANEYLPILSNDGKKLFFSAMDRTGFFDFKLDYNKQKSAGGEDVFISENQNGIWADARPLTKINTNGHEVLSQVFENRSLLVTANYPENFGSQSIDDAGVLTTDIYFIKSENTNFQINHFPEPVNSIYSEADGWMDENENYILFVSDRVGNIGEYHKKGWKWNDSFWGNTDVYVSLKDGDNWTIPINLGSKVNTIFSERTPWLSNDGLTLYLSSNGYKVSKTDLDVYAFKRKSVDDWTSWEGPFEIQDANTLNDDWGYKELSNGDAYLASSNKLGYKPTQGGAVGDGGIRETNYRPGYVLHGLQIASLNSECETNIYYLKNPQTPAFVVEDVFFEIGSSKINSKYEKKISLIVDQISQNKEYKIIIIGYTDDIGNNESNQQLSLDRAESVKSCFLNNKIKNQIITEGKGELNPIFPNNSNANRMKNRRVEIFLKQ